MITNPLILPSHESVVTWSLPDLQPMPHLESAILHGLAAHCTSRNRQSAAHQNTLFSYDWYCAGWLHFEARDFAKADKAFERLVNVIAKNDDYGWLGLASIMLTSVPSKRRKV